jgi:hypothetical protein
MADVCEEIRRKKLTLNAQMSALLASYKDEQQCANKEGKPAVEARMLTYADVC